MEAVSCKDLITSLRIFLSSCAGWSSWWGYLIKSKEKIGKETSQEAEVQKDFGGALSRKKLHRRLEKIYPEGREDQHAS
jgi:hypothetical protein